MIIHCIAELIIANHDWRAFPNLTWGSWSADPNDDEATKSSWLNLSGFITEMTFWYPFGPKPPYFLVGPRTQIPSGDFHHTWQAKYQHHLLYLDRKLIYNASGGRDATVLFYDEDISQEDTPYIPHQGRPSRTYTKWIPTVIIHVRRCPSCVIYQSRCATTKTWKTTHLSPAYNT